MHNIKRADEEPTLVTAKHMQTFLQLAKVHVFTRKTLNMDDIQQKAPEKKPLLSKRHKRLHFTAQPTWMFNKLFVNRKQI